MRLRSAQYCSRVVQRGKLSSKEVASTNTAYVQATADSTAENATYEVRVHKLATNHTVAMQSDIQTLLGKSTAESLGLAGKFTPMVLRSRLKAESP